jgi:hypothetical protein
LYWHKCQCWQVAQHECKFRICSIRCLESCRLDMPINCLRKMEKATLQPRIWKFLRKYIDCCFFKILSCHSVYLSHAILSRRSFVAALFCRGALLSLRSFVAALILRLSFVARSFVTRSNVVDSKLPPANYLALTDTLYTALNNVRAYLFRFSANSLPLIILNCLVY